MGLWCRHRKQTSPRHDREGDYRRCLDCGVRIPWSWSKGPKLQTLWRLPLAGWMTLWHGLVLGRRNPRLRRT